jgi:serine/threonine-protein kinase
MLRALADVPATPFVPPSSGLTTATIDTRSGCLADKFTPAEFRAVGTFAPGTAPTHTCTAPGDVARVPNVVGFSSVSAAVSLLENAGFAVDQAHENSTSYPPGVVISQSPGGGDKALRGSTVTITISDGSSGGGTTGGDQATVPTVLGLTRTQAEANLRNAGFSPRTVTEAESSPGQARKNSGRVWKQDPASGSQVPHGSTVTIYVNP